MLSIQARLNYVVFQYVMIVNFFHGIFMLVINSDHFIYADQIMCVTQTWHRLNIRLAVVGNFNPSCCINHIRGGGVKFMGPPLRIFSAGMYSCPLTANLTICKLQALYGLAKTGGNKRVPERSKGERYHIGRVRLIHY